MQIYVIFVLITASSCDKQGPLALDKIGIQVNRFCTSHQKFRAVGVGGCGGERGWGNGGNFGTGVQASILKPTPFIYLAFENRSFIY